MGQSLAVQVQGQGTLSADNLNTYQQTCDNVAALRAFIGAAADNVVVQVYVRGTVTAGDGGQGVFYWNATGAAPDDNGVTTIVPTCAASGEWTRLGSTSGTFVTGPVSSIIGDIAVFSNTSGSQLNDSGVRIGSLAPLNSPSFTGTETRPDGSTVTTSGQASTGVPGGAKGAGTVNATGLYVNGVAVTTGIYPLTYLAVAGGGGGGAGFYGGGGGAGGVLPGTNIIVSGTSAIAITVGSGGAGSTNASNVGSNGNNSTISGLIGGTVTALGGGGAGSFSNGAGASGGSGGGAAGDGANAGGTATAGQGNIGGTGTNTSAGAGGGGAGAVGGAPGLLDTGVGGVGGAGLSSSITGSAVTYGGGGGGGNRANPSGTGGAGGAGGGGAGGTSANGSNGTANTGGGGGGGGTTGSNGGAGGSGIVILSVPTAFYSGVVTGSPSVTTSGGNTILTFAASGSYTP